MERLYLDTSVFGGYFEPEFQLWTKILFDRIKKGQYKLLLSRVIDIELTNAPQYVKDLAISIPDKYIEFIETTDEVTQLADTYINENEREKRKISHATTARHSRQVKRRHQGHDLRTIKRVFRQTENTAPNKGLAQAGGKCKVKVSFS